MLNLQRFRDYYSMDDIDPIIRETPNSGMVSPCRQKDQNPVKLENHTVISSPGYKEVTVPAGKWLGINECIHCRMPLILFKQF